jgi:putative transposase
MNMNKAVMPGNWKYHLMAVSVRGCCAWKERKPSLRQCYDLVLAANIRAQFASSNQPYGAPRTNAEVCKEAGCHHVARLMRENGLKVH